MGVCHRRGKIRFFFFHLFTGNRDFLQAGFHGAQHCGQTGLVAQGGGAAVHRVQHRVLMLFQGVFFFRFFRPGLLLRRLCGFQPGGQFLQ